MTTSCKEILKYYLISVSLDLRGKLKLGNIASEKLCKGDIHTNKSLCQSIKNNISYLISPSFNLTILKLGLNLRYSCWSERVFELFYI